MKIITTVIILFAALAARAANTKLPHVSVYGTALIKVVPDEMIWSLSVKTEGNEIGQVAEAHDNKVSVALAFLQGQKIEAKQIQTSRIKLAANRVLRGGGSYNAFSQIVFKSGDLQQYRALWMGVAKLTDVSVAGVSFDLSQRIKHQNDSRLEAVKAAKEKAPALVKALGATVHEPILIKEVLDERDPFVASDVMLGSLQAGAGSTISVKTRLQVKFRISSE